MAFFAPAASWAGLGEGALVTRVGKRVVDVPLEHTEVTIRVAGRLADVGVVQRFRSTSAQKIEAIYAFPLPAGAAVDRFFLRTGEEQITGVLERRSEAKLIYQRAKALGKIAALLEEERPGSFTQSVANIEPGATVEVELHYFQALELEDERYELVFPMVMSPRPISASAAAAAAPKFLPPDLRSSHEIGLSVELDAGVLLHALTSPSHRITVTRPSASRATIALSGDDTIPNKDFVLRYEVGGEDPSAGLLAGRSSFLLTVQPPRDETAPLLAPRELVFALDTSSSMAGAPLAKAKAIVRRALSALMPEDTFQIIGFSDRPVLLGERPIAAKSHNVEQALGWLDALEAGGGTEMISGVQAALEFPHDPLRLRLVVFITDGYVGDEQAILQAVRERLGDARIFAFGIGSAVNRYLLEEMSGLGRGTFSVLRADEDERAAVARLAARIARPVLTDISVDWKGLPVSALVPERIPDLFVGQPISVHGKYSGAGKATIVVSGSLGGKRVEIPVEVELPEPGRDTSKPAVDAVWARARIHELERARLRDDGPELAEEITALALENRLLTEFTAFVAVSERSTGKGPLQVVPVPLEVPDGLAQVQAFSHGYGALGVGAVGYGSGGGSASYAMSLSASNYGSGGGGLGYGGVGAVHITPAIIVHESAATITGSLDKDLIRRMLAQHRGAIKYCYEKRLISNPKLFGRIVVRFTIEPTGLVSSSSIAESSLDDHDVEECVAQRIKTVMFPAVAGGGVVVVNMPYVFNSTGVEMP